MPLNDLLFYLFAALTVAFGLLTVANPVSRNPVTSAMFLVLTIASMAGLFVLLHAFFLAAVQILVYAGAVMVLFLFVIMLLDIKEEERRRFNRFGVLAGLVSVASLAGVVITTLLTLRKPDGSNAVGPVIEGSTRVLGRELFTRFILPFEVVSLILLVAMVGVILLSKKDLK